MERVGLGVQVAGSHYKDRAVQPFELTWANRYDPLIFSVMKYLMRFEEKNGAVDLEKAMHCCFIRCDLLNEHNFDGFAAKNAMDVSDVCDRNGYGPQVRNVMCMLHRWAFNTPSMLPDQHVAYATAISNKIVQLIRDEYPKHEINFQIPKKKESI